MSRYGKSIYDQLVEVIEKLDKVLTEKGLNPIEPDYLLDEKELEDEIQKNPVQEEK